MRLAPAVLLLTALAACASAGRGPTPARQLGTYHFRLNVPNTSPSIMLEGVVRVQPDTILVESASGSCRYERRRQTSTSLTYDCPDGVFTIDRHQPVTRSYYAVPTTVRVSERVCAEWVRNAQGIQTCARWRTEHHDRQTVRSGRLTLMRV